MPEHKPSPLAARHWSEYVLSATAVLISGLSLWVAVGSEDANRKLVAAASWPLLQVWPSNLDTQGNPVISIAVVNAGVGPARIKTFEVFWKGKPYRSPQALLVACCGWKAQPFTAEATSRPAGGLVMTTIPGLVIRAGESRSAITLPLVAENAQSWHALDKAATHVGFTYRVCYCSVFDECWIAGENSDDPKRVDKCPTPPVPFR